MKLNKLIMLLALALPFMSFGANIVYDFRNGIHPDIKLYDLDNLTPSADVEYTGLAKGVAWAAYDVEKTGNKVAVSTSWYQPAGKSNDWMVLPAVTITADSELRWTARAFDKQLPDGYSVYISDKGDSPEDFDTANPVFRVDAESSDWTDHNILLDKYEGKSIYIAFVNESEDCNMLLVKSITIGVPEKLIVNFSGERSIVNPGDNIPLKFVVSSDLTESQTLLRAVCKVDDKEFTLSDLGTLEPGNTVEFEFPDAFVEAKKDVLTDARVLVESNLGRTEKSVYLGNCHRNMIAEEATGNWCQWCVSGMVVFEEMKKKYPDQAICIAVHESDVMSISGYKVKGSGNPRLTLNREGSDMHPLELEANMVPHLSDLPQVAVEGEWSITDSEVKVNAKLLPGIKSDALYRMAFALIENDVHVPDNNKYNQKNAYAGGAEGPMGGFENRPAVIPSDDMWYQDVARGIFPSQNGISCNSLTTLNVGEKSEFSHSFKLPDNVLNADNLELIVIVTDAASGIILNGCVAKNNNTGGTGIQNGVVDTDAAVTSVAWYDISGRRVLNPNQEINIRVERYSDGTAKAKKIYK